MHRFMKDYTNRNKSSGIMFIEIPIDDTIPWNSIPSTIPTNQWRQIDNPAEIEKVLTSRNTAHLSQPEGTSFTIAPLKYLLEPDNFTPFGDDFLTGTANLEFLPLSKLQKRYFNNLKKRQVYSPPYYHLISRSKT